MYNFKDKKRDVDGKTMMSHATNISEVSYQEFYKRINEMCKAENYSDEQKKKFLGDRPFGEKEYKKVSCFLILANSILVGCKKEGIIKS